jgi:hypothetical protein
MFDFIGGLEDIAKFGLRGSLAVVSGGLSETSYGRKLQGEVNDAIFGGDDAAPISPLGAPPAPPDLTDQAIQRAAMLQRRRQLLGQGLGSMFVSGPLGDASAPPTAQTTAVGS